MDKVSDFKSWKEVSDYLSEGELVQIECLDFLVRSHYIQYGCCCCGEEFPSLSDTISYLQSSVDISEVSK